MRRQSIDPGFVIFAMVIVVMIASVVAIIVSNHRHPCVRYEVGKCG